MTPAQLNVYAKAYMQRKQEEQRIARVNIYNLASLIRPMVWSKHPPEFDEAFPDKRKNEPVEMDDDQLYAAVKRLNALFGGEEVD